MTTITATAARRKIFDMVKDATQRHKTYRIHHRKGSAVLLSEEDYESMMETLELLSIPGFRASIKRSINQAKRGETCSMEELFEGRR